MTFRRTGFARRQVLWWLLPGQTPPKHWVAPGEEELEACFERLEGTAAGDPATSEPEA